MERKIPNRLIHEKSPYLLQHAYNPVDWFPWSEEAFNLAREKDCLVFLSIGYATCHWCHVMEKESFEDKKTADFLNEHFVSIKVDREERPDIDSIYMDALQAMEGQGGWPLNMFLTPEKIPVIGGTYFPSEPRYGRKSFLDVLGILHVTWKEKRGDIIKASEEMLRFLQSSVREQQSEELPSESCIQKTYETYNHFYDETYFGFKTNASNKFPPSMGLSFLISYFIKTKNSKAKEMVEKTLLAMKKGGIYDQVGGGLCRYSTDSMWLVPHFEKMLYDNALFISILAETYRLEKREIFKQAALDVINYVERDLVLDEGGIASAEDADSEGEEGKFYLWDLSHFQEILGTDAEFFSAYWHLSEEGNFEGKNILNENFRIYPLPEEEDSSLSARKEKVRKSLLEERNKRIRPQRDDKVLTSWNCLYIRALIESGMSFSDESLIQKAKNHYEFINTHLFNSEGRLLRRYREGESAIPAYLVDYAELAYVSILLYKISFNIDYMKRAVFLTDESIRLFYSGFGPFFETGSDAEGLIRRSIQSYDGVEPSGNSTMAMVLLELCRYGHKKYYGYLKSLFSYFKEDLEKYGMSHAFLLKVYLLYTGGPSREIIIIGEKENEELQKILNVYYTHFVPGLSFAVSTKDELSINSELIPLLKGRETEKDFVLYICENNSCKLPIFSMSDALQVLNAQFSMDEGVHL